MKTKLYLLMFVFFVGCCLFSVFYKSKRFEENLPILLPQYHGVLRAFSEDGLQFKVDQNWLIDEADTHHFGTNRDIYFYDGIQDQLFVYDDKRKTRTPLMIEGDCSIDSSKVAFCVDPDFVTLRDGRFRLYYVSLQSHGNPAYNPSEIHSAISTDGENWVREEGIRIQDAEAVDPDVIQLPDGRFRMYYSKATPKGAAGGVQMVIASAISDDGLVFTIEEGIRLHRASASDSILLDNGSIRTYYHDLHSNIYSAISKDGIHFTREKGIRIPKLSLPDSRYIGAEFPSITKEDDLYWITFNTAIEPWFPWNEWAVIQSERLNSH